MVNLTGVRFAPSPTGRFHVGNLRTAWISARWAKALGEPWIVRFEDIDLPRVVLGAREAQLGDLASLGLVPDRIDLQSTRRARHFSLFENAVKSGTLYPCTCSRKEVQEALRGLASAPHGALPIYTGYCRRTALDPTAGAERIAGSGGIAWRFRTADETGNQDFIVARTAEVSINESTFTPAYHWACAIDDFDGAHRLLVRAWDLETSTPLQREIQNWISSIEGRGSERAAVFHAALIVQNDGHRLEKRTAGVTLSELHAAGWTTNRILAGFDRSFTAAMSAVEPEKIFGEATRERTLADLGF
jgi:glutamyl-tRNA synthetase